MLKRIAWLVAALLIAALPVLAQTPALVVDEAGLLTREELDSLEDEARALSDAHQMDIVIVTQRSIGGRAALDYAADYYDYNGYGQGTRGDGVLLLLSMEERDWAIVTTGRGIGAFTDYAQAQIMDDVVPFFSAGDYARGFQRFLRDADICLTQAETGRPYDVDNRLQLKSVPERVFGMAGWIALAALVITGITMTVMILRMRSERPQRGARHYEREGSMRLDRSLDVYLYRSEVRTRIEKSSGSSSSGGSSTFTSSSGRTHGGSSGKF